MSVKCPQCGSYTTNCCATDEEFTFVPFDELTKLEITKRDIDILFCKINKVTAPHRHGNKVTNRALDDLANEQINFEAKYSVI